MVGVPTIAKASNKDVEKFLGSHHGCGNQEIIVGRVHVATNLSFLVLVSGFVQIEAHK